MRFTPPKSWLEKRGGANHQVIGLCELICYLDKEWQGKDGKRMIEIGSHAGESTFMWGASGFFDKIVAIDPGKCDLIYCVDNSNKEANKFRYSQNQRRKETKMKKYNNIILGNYFGCVFLRNKLVVKVNFNFGVLRKKARFSTLNFWFSNIFGAIQNLSVEV